MTVSLQAGDQVDRGAVWEALRKRLSQESPVMVTRPTMPKLSEYVHLLEGIWERRWLTNEGDLHKQLERELATYLGAEHLSVFCNGATALLVALQALRISGGEVITTPFTFPATTHVLYWNRVRPVFCDIEPETFNLDPAMVERLIGPETRAILPVHVYGNPCDVDALQAIADRHGLQIIYDAAHAFGVRVHGKPIVSYGDMSMLSFHATKLFSTIEGGALISKTAVQKERVNSLKNFGIHGEDAIIGPGINGKMNEFQAAFGLLHLRLVDEEIRKRHAIALRYREKLKKIPGLRVQADIEGVEHNYAYFPVLVDPVVYGVSRNKLHRLLREFNVFSRKYFFPLVSHAPCYAALPSADARHLPVAEGVASQVLCLPIYGTLSLDTVDAIVEILAQIPSAIG